jgi:hypothetical protein
MGTGTPYGYNVFMGTAPGAEDLSVSVTVVAGTSYAVTGLTNGTKYYFVVQTVTSAGVSAISNEANSTPAAQSPTAPTSRVAPAKGPVAPVSAGVIPATAGQGAQGASPSGTGTGQSPGPETKGASSGGLTLTASPTKGGGMTAVTYKVKVPGARGGTVLIKAGSRLVCTIQLDNQGQGQCTSSRWNGRGAVTAAYTKGGTQKALSVSLKTAAVPASYWVATSDGSVLCSGGAPSFGSLLGENVRVSNILGLAPAPDGRGYWMVGRDGGIFAFGSAHFFGSLGGKTLASPIVGLAGTSDGRGYWLAGANGAVSAFGSARTLGSLAPQALGSPIVGMAPTPDDQGYWLVSRDGSVTSFGNATSLGTPKGLRPGTGVVGIAVW